MKVTKITFSDNLNKGKFAQLNEQARRLGNIRSEVWHRYGSMTGVGLRDRKIRDQWLQEGRNFPVLANAWKETLRDAIGDIHASMESAKVMMRQSIRRHTNDQKEQTQLYTLLKRDQWLNDSYLSRMMRKHWNRGHNHTSNQIVVRSDDYSVFELNGKLWIKIPGLVKGKKIAIPLTSNRAPSGTLRVLLKKQSVEIHYSVDVEQMQTCGDKVIGVDKGYTEVLTDSDGKHHGQSLGKILSARSDHLKEKHQKRNKIKGVVDKLRKKGNDSKADKIVNNNLGRNKLNQQTDKNKKQIRTIIFTAVHDVVDKASDIVSEDLTAVMSGKKFSKNVNRRLASWTKGVIAEALDNVSQRRGSTLHYVNPAYTSQMDSITGLLEGKRVGDKFYRINGDVLQADMNAARNVLARLYDQEIDRWTPYKKVKSILLKRIEANRLKLFNQDSSCKLKSLSTESELPNEQLCSSI